MTICGTAVIGRRDDKPYVISADTDVCIAQELIDEAEAGTTWADSGEGWFVVHGTNRTLRYRLVGPCTHTLGDPLAWRAVLR